MVISDSLKEHVQEVEENYLYSMPTWLIILITVIGTFIFVIGLVIYCYCIYKWPSDRPRVFSATWDKKNTKSTVESKPMFPNLP